MASILQEELLRSVSGELEKNKNDAEATVVDSPLTDQGDPASASSSVLMSDFKARFENLARQKKNDLERNAVQSLENANIDQKNPDAHGLNVRRADGSNIPVVVAEDNKADFDHFDLRKQMKKRNVGMQHWLSNADNAAVSRDDLSSLDYLAEMWDNTRALGAATGASWETGNAIVDVGTLGFKNITGTITPKELLMLEIREEDLQKLQEQLRNSQFGATTAMEQIAKPSGFLLSTAESLPMMIHTTIGSADEIAWGGMLGAGVGWATTAGTPVGILPGFYFGMLSGWRAGSGIEAGKLEAGLAFQEYIKLKTENGELLDRNAARAAALVTGAINGALEVIPLTKILRAAPGGEAFFKGFTRQGIKAALQRPTVRRAFLTYGKRIASAGGTEAITEFLQELTTKISGRVALAIKQGRMGDLANGNFWIETLGESSYAGVRGAMGGTGMSTATGAPTVVLDINKARNAEKAKLFFDNLAENAQKSKTRQRAPGRFGDFIEEQAAGTGTETVYVDARRLFDMFQDQGVTQEEVVAEFNIDSTEADVAVASGGSVEIPIGEFASKIAANDALYKGIETDIKFTPDSITIREKVANEQEIQSRTDDAVAAYVDKYDNADDEQIIFTEIVSQLRNAGLGTDAATQTAQAALAFFVSQAEIRDSQGVKMTPLEVFSRYPFEIERFLPEGLKVRQDLAVTEETIIERARTGRRQTERQLFGPSLLDFVRSMGIRYDPDAAAGQTDIAGGTYQPDAEIGDILGMDIDQDLKPGQRRALRPDGMTIDDLALAAQEEGYFPARDLDQGDRIAINDFLAALNENIAGNFSYVPRFERTQEVMWDDAADELTSALNSIGLDPRDMTADEIREVINRERTRQIDDGGVEFEHGAYHGSGAERLEGQRLDISRVGDKSVGEGHTAFGWGLYFASERGIAEHYRRQNATRKLLVNGTPVHEYFSAEHTLLSRGMDGDIRPHNFNFVDVLRNIFLNFEEYDIPFEDSKKQSLLQYGIDLNAEDPAVSKSTEHLMRTTESEALWRSDLNKLIELREDDVQRSEGSLYRVELQPDIDDYLNFSQDLSEMSDQVQQQIRHMLNPSEGVYFDWAKSQDAQRAVYVDLNESLETPEGIWKIAQNLYRGTMSKIDDKILKKQHQKWVKAGIITQEEADRRYAVLAGEHGKDKKRKAEAEEHHRQQMRVVYERGIDRVFEGTSEAFAGLSPDWRIFGGERLYRNLSSVLGGDKQASMMLRDAGIPGNKFLDSNTRSEPVVQPFGHGRELVDSQFNEPIEVGYRDDTLEQPISPELLYAALGNNLELDQQITSDVIEAAINDLENNFKHGQRVDPAYEAFAGLDGQGVDVQQTINYLRSTMLPNPERFLIEKTGGGFNYVLYDDSLVDVTGKQGIDFFQSSVPLQSRPLKLEGSGPHGRVTNWDFAEALTERHMEKHGRALDPDNPEDMKLIVREGSREFANQAREDETGEMWYTEDISEAMATTALYIPELDANLNNAADYEELFLVMAALLSPQERPPQNWEKASLAFEGYVPEGTIPDKKPNGKGWGVNAKALPLLQYLLDTKGIEQTLMWLREPHSGKELAEMRRASGLFKEGDKSQSLGKYNASETRHDGTYLGIYMFGPKVGDFWMNSTGHDLEAVTVDLWLARSYNRHIGRLLDVIPTLKAKRKIISEVRSGERETIKAWVREMADKNGIKPSAMQAALWYYEQRLFRNHGIQSESTNFSGSAVLAAERRGVTVPRRGRDVPGTLEAERATEAAAARPELNQSGDPTEVVGADPRILYQQQENPLVVTHNITANKLLHADKMGGLPVPSLAVSGAEMPFDNFGEISLIGSKDLIDPRASRRNRVFNADIYSPRYPRAEYVVDRDRVNEIAEELNITYLIGGLHDGIQDKGLKYLENLEEVRRKFLEEIDADPPKNERLDSQIRERQAEFSQWVRDNAGDVIKGERIFDGFTPSGTRIYLPHNLDNVVRIMRRELRGGEKWNYGVGSIRASKARQFKSIKDIQDSREAIVSEAQMQQFKDEADDQFGELAQMFQEFYTGDRNRFGSLTLFSETLQEVGKHGLKELDYQFPNASEEALVALVSFLESLKEAPTEYFEAKIQRAVSINEFAGAVVPRGTRSDVISALEDSGLKISYYDKGAGGVSRQEATAQFEDEFFQSRRGRDLLTEEDKQEAIKAANWFSDLSATAKSSESLEDTLVDQGLASKFDGEFWTPLIDDLQKRGVDLTQVKEGDVLPVSEIKDWMNIHLQDGRGVDLSPSDFDRKGVFSADDFELVVLDLEEGGSAELRLKNWDNVEERLGSQTSLDARIETLEDALNHPSHMARAAAFKKVLEGLGVEFWEDGSDVASKYFYVEVKPDTKDEYGRHIKIRFSDHTGQSALHERADYNIADNGYDTAMEALDEIVRANDKAAVFQPRRGGPRGSFTAGENFGEGGMSTIRLFENADLSTTLHELSHFYLEVMRDRAKRPLAGEQIKRDWQTLEDWWAKNPELIAEKANKEAKGRGLDINVTADQALTYSETGTTGNADLDMILFVAQHEVTADAHEIYLMEGKSPSLQLAEAFERFSAWMIRIYSSITNLGVTPPEEVKKVFDRWLATEAEIKEAEEFSAAEAMFKTFEEYDGTKEEYEEYRAAETRAHAQAKQKLMRRKMRDIEAQQTAEMQDLKDEIYDQVANEINQMPVYRLWEWLARGRVLAGEQPPEFLEAGKRLSKSWLVSNFGEDIISILPKGGNRIHQRDLPGNEGLNPEVVADAFGFKSVDEMINAILNSPNRKKFLEQEQKKRLENDPRWQGDTVQSGNIEEAALEDIHNDERGTFLHLELEAINKKGKLGKPSARQIAKEIARRTISRIKIGSAIQAGKFRATEAKFAKEAQKAVADGDFEAASRAKYHQLLNHYLYTESLKARDEVEKAVKYVRKFSGPAKRLRNIDYDYVERIQEILSAFQFTSRLSDAKREKLQSQALEKWAEAKNKNEGAEILIPQEILDADEKTNYRDIPVSEFRALVDTIKNLEIQGRLTTKITMAGQKLELDNFANEINDSIFQNWHGGFKNINEPPSDKQKKISSLKRTFGLRKMEFIMRRLDGFKYGPMSRIFRMIAEADDNFAERRAEAALMFREIWGVYTPREMRRMSNKKIFVKEINMSLTKDAILAVALNVGNEDNRAKMMEGYGWNDDQVDAILRYLDDRDWGVVQNVFDHLQSYWSETVKLDTERRGFPASKVEGRPIILDGVEKAKGGYYPLKWDHLADGKSRDDLLEPYDLLKMGGQSMSSHPSTHVGRTIERQASAGGRKVNLSGMGVYLKAVDETIHDLSWRATVKDVTKIMKHKTVREAILQTMGRDFIQQFDDWFSDSVIGDQSDPRTADQVFRILRSRISVATMGWKISTAAVQPLGYFSTMSRFVQDYGIARGGYYALKGLKDFYGNPARMKERIDFVMERSPMMRQRSKTFDRDVYDNLKRLRKGKYGEVEASFFWLTSKLQLAVDMPTWMAAFEAAQVNDPSVTEEQAAAEADSVVRMTQSSGAAKDLTNFQRGGEGKKLFSFYMTFFAAMTNMIEDQFVLAKRNRKYIPRTIASLFLLTFMPVLMEEYIKSILGVGGPDEDEEEGWGEYLAKKWASFSIAGIPVVRDIANVVLTDFDYTFSPTAGALKRASDAVSGIKEYIYDESEEEWFSSEELDKRLAKSLVDAASIAIPLPGSQLKLTGEYFYDLWEGEKEPDNWANFMAEAFYRKDPKDYR